MQDWAIQHPEFVMNSNAFQELFEVAGPETEVFDPRNNERQKEGEQNKEYGGEDSPAASNWRQ